jgi:signal recognition particle receptor subunit beta
MAAQFANSAPTPTHTSQTTTAAACRLPPSARTAADQYRSENDTSAHSQPTFQLIDTPGHGKLRHQAYSLVNGEPASAPKGILFVLDAAAPSLADAAAYLHDVLLVLQKRRTQAKTSKLPPVIPVLVAANKQDVFTALPAPVVRRRLEEEIGNVRSSRSRGLLDSSMQGDEGAGIGNDDDEEASWLGEYGSKKFSFEQLAEFGVDVTVAGGNVLAEGEEGRDSGRRVQEWWDWIAESL